MGQLGDILELFFGRADPFRSVRAIVRERTNAELEKKAESGATKLWGRKKVVVGTSAEGSQRFSEKTLSMWVAPPSRTRLEERSAEDASLEASLRVIDGDRWTTRDAEGHVESGEGESRGGPAFTDVERHFDPNLIREFFKKLSLEARGSVRAASRECVRLNAVLRPGESLWPHWLPKSADEYEFHADRERGVLLALFGLYKGNVFWSSEVTEVHFDEGLADDLFAYEPRQGEQIRPAVPVVEDITLGAAIARMPFTVFVPSRTPGFDPTHHEFMYHPARPNSPRPYLGVHVRSDSHKFLLINEGADEDPDLQKYEWEHLCQNGEQIRISDPGPGRGYRCVALKKQDTYVDIWSELEREQVIEVATSLVPAIDHPG